MGFYATFNIISVISRRQFTYSWSLGKQTSTRLENVPCPRALHHYCSAATGDRTRDTRFEIPDANTRPQWIPFILKIPSKFTSIFSMISLMNIMNKRDELGSPCLTPSCERIGSEVFEFIFTADLTDLLVAGQKPATSIFNRFSEITWEGGLLLERNTFRCLEHITIVFV